MSDPEGIDAFLRLDDRLTSSGQPDEDQLRALAVTGVETVVNLGLHSHERALPDEAASVAALGMEYVHIPVDFADPKEADFDRFCEVMDRRRDRRVHVHCIVNARVSAFLYRYRRDRLGWDEATARADMARIWNPADWGERGEPWLRFLGWNARNSQ